MGSVNIKVPARRTQCCPRVRGGLCCGSLQHPLRRLSHLLFLLLLYSLTSCSNGITAQTKKEATVPLLGAIPETPFRCLGHSAGYYADPDTGCQVYHMCDTLERQYSYLCPNYTLFNQKFMVCDHWYMVNCSTSHTFYHLNGHIGEVSEKSEREEQQNTLAVKPGEGASTKKSKGSPTLSPLSGSALPASRPGGSHRPSNHSENPRKHKPVFKQHRSQARNTTVHGSPTTKPSAPVTLAATPSSTSPGSASLRQPATSLNVQSSTPALRPLTQSSRSTTKPRQPFISTNHSAASARQEPTTPVRQPFSPARPTSARPRTQSTTPSRPAFTPPRQASILTTEQPFTLSTRQSSVTTTIRPFTSPTRRSFVPTTDRSLTSITKQSSVPTRDQPFTSSRQPSIPTTVQPFTSPTRRSSFPTTVQTAEQPFTSPTRQSFIPTTAQPRTSPTRQSGVQPSRQPVTQTITELTTEATTPPVESPTPPLTTPNIEFKAHNGTDARTELPFVSVTRNLTLPGSSKAHGAQREENPAQPKISLNMMPGNVARSPGNRFSFTSHKEEEPVLTPEELQRIVFQPLLARPRTKSRRILTNAPSLLPIDPSNSSDPHHHLFPMRIEFHAPAIPEDSSSRDFLDLKLSNSQGAQTPSRILQPPAGSLVLHSPPAVLFPPTLPFTPARAMKQEFPTHLEVPPQTDNLRTSPRDAFLPGARRLPFPPSSQGNRDFFIPSAEFSLLVPEVPQNTVEERTPGTSHGPSSDHHHHHGHHGSHMTMVFPAPIEPSKMKELRINPECPRCHPEFLKPGQCHPCVVIK